MPRLTAARRQDRYELILEAARSVFEENGFEPASIAQIARAAGVSDGLIYRYFQDKRAILYAVLADFITLLLEAGQQAVAQQSDFRGRLEALIAGHLRSFAIRPRLCRLYLDEVRGAAGYSGSPVHSAARAYTDLLVRIVEAGIAAGEVRPDTDPRMVRDLVFGGIEHIAWRSITGGQTLDNPDLVGPLLDLFLHGITSPTGKTA